MKKIIFMLGVITCLISESCTNEQYIDSDSKNLSNKVILEWNELAYHAFGGEA